MAIGLLRREKRFRFFWLLKSVVRFSCFLFVWNILCFCFLTPKTKRLILFFVLSLVKNFVLVDFHFCVLIISFFVFGGNVDKCEKTLPLFGSVFSCIEVFSFFLEPSGRNHDQGGGVVSGRGDRGDAGGRGEIEGSVFYRRVCGGDGLEIIGESGGSVALES